MAIHINLYSQIRIRASPMRGRATLQYNETQAIYTWAIINILFKSLDNDIIIAITSI